jgi:hypothetical protein
MPFIALILFAILKKSIFFYMLPAAILSYFLKKLALKKAITENKDSYYKEAIEKDINTAKWAVIMILGLAFVDFIYRYS